MPTDRLVEMQLARLMQPEDPGRREGLRVRGDAEAVPGVSASPVSRLATPKARSRTRAPPATTARTQPGSSVVRI